MLEEQFDQARKRFTGQQTLVEIRQTENDRQVVVHKRPETVGRTSLRWIRVLAYDGREGGLVHVDVPIWLARMTMSNRGGLGHRSFTINGENIEFDAADLTFEDVERHGHGLIADVGDGRGSQVLV